MIHTLDRVILLGIVLLALFLRLAYLHDLQDYEFLDHLLLDPKAYDDQAVAILEGTGPAPGLPYYQAPLYPHFLAAVYAAAGHRYDAVRLVQLLLGAVTILLTARIGMVLFGRATGILAGLAGVLYAPFPFYEAQIMKTSLAVFLAVAGCFVLLRWRSVRSTLLAGFLLGLAALVRENLVLLLVAGALFVAWGRGEGEGSLRRALLVLLAGAIAVAPVTIRNWVVSGELVLVTSQGGQNFFIGNNEMAQGTYTDLPFVRPDPRYEQIDFRREAQRRLGKELSPAALSRYWYGQAFAWIGREPGKAASLFWRKFLLFWNDREIPDNENFYYLRERFSTLRLFPLTFGAVAPFALLGMVASLGRLRARFLIFAAVGVNLLALVAFYLFSRYRIAALPFLLLFAAEGFLLLLRLFRERRWAGAFVSAAALFAAFFVANQVSPIGFDPKKDGYLPLHVNRAMMFAEEGDRARAIEEYRQALGIAPQNGLVRKRIGRLLALEGRTQEAAAEMEQAADLLPGDAGVRNDLALLYLRLGGRERAFQLFEEAVGLDPAREGPHRNLARLLTQMGRLEEGAREEAIADSLREWGRGR